MFVCVRFWRAHVILFGGDGLGPGGVVVGRGAWRACCVLGVTEAAVRCGCGGGALEML